MKDQWILKTNNWIENWVIELNLCPFAKVPFEKNRIKYVVYEGNSEEELSKVLWKELIQLANDTTNEVETTFLIHPHVGVEFQDYLVLVSWAQGHLEALELEGVIQIAEFHPSYQFSRTDNDDAENYTNRSPFPMLHLLKEASISRAVDQFDNIESIPQRNIEYLNELGLENIKEKLKDIL